MTTHNTTDIRQYLTNAYSDDDITVLCSDYFREVYDDFTAGMSKRQKIQLLLDYCIRYVQVEGIAGRGAEGQPGAVSAV